jgi:hypothetical protein
MFGSPPFSLSIQPPSARTIPAEIAPRFPNSDENRGRIHSNVMLREKNG